MRDEPNELAFNARENETLGLMISLGMPRNISKVLLFLSKKGEATSQKIEISMGLRQSEVSIALKNMRGRGGVTSKSLKRKGKGRPTQLYRLKISLRRIIKEIEGEKLKEIEDMKKKIARLKRFAK
ncbi:MAG: ArsR family transcriptional regulator [Methanomassiliicoccales archaeon]|nr:MAG: ArsR family transcriptional regulator [Methanomassiliicoccales archaeon]